MESWCLTPDGRHRMTVLLKSRTDWPMTFLRIRWHVQSMFEGLGCEDFMR